MAAHQTPLRLSGHGTEDYHQEGTEDSVNTMQRVRHSKRGTTSETTSKIQRGQQSEQDMANKTDWTSRNGKVTTNEAQAEKREIQTERTHIKHYTFEQYISRFTRQTPHGRRHTAESYGRSNSNLNSIII
jgi:hypothetical protein